MYDRLCCLSFESDLTSEFVNILLELVSVFSSMYLLIVLGGTYLLLNIVSINIFKAIWGLSSDYSIAFFSPSIYPLFTCNATNVAKS